MAKMPAIASTTSEKTLTAVTLMPHN
jgi:hypothetical protein